MIQYPGLMFAVSPLNIEKEITTLIVPEGTNMPLQESAV